MTVAYAVAAVLIVGLAAGHSGLGEQLILRRLDIASLPTTRFGGQKSTERLIRVTWHLLSAAFLVLAGATASCAVLGPSDPCRGVGWVTGASFASFFAVALALALLRGGPRKLLSHPAPLGFAAVAVLAWLGAS